MEFEAREKPNSRPVFETSLDSDDSTGKEIGSEFTPIHIRDARPKAR